MIEEIHQVSLAETQTSPPAHRQVTTGKFLPTLRGRHDRETIRLFRERAVIPTALGTKVPKRLHQTFPGIEEMNSLAGK
jgi:hypothetical protein